MEDQIPYGYCHCGCGEKTRLANQHNVKFGYTKGEPLKFINGHNQRGGPPTWMQEVYERDGFCECGCGEKAPLAKTTDPRFGYVKGYPLRVILGHHLRKSHVDYVEEDRGYSTHCWIWQGALSHGYGRMNSGSGDAQAHRRYYEQAYGPIDKGMHLHHECETPACVNPEHLTPLTNSEHRKLHSAARRRATQQD